MSQTIITARRLLTHLGPIEYPVITITADGAIADISSDPKGLTREQDTLSAAFLDIHTHGGRGHDVMSATTADFSDLQRFLARHGTANYLPTTVTASVETTLHSLESLADTVERTTPGDEAKPVGIHLEGPFLSHAKRGVHPDADLQAPSIALFDRFWQAARGRIRLVTIAPETGTTANPPYEGSSDTALELIAHCAKLGVRISIGHSNADTADTLAAIDAGATSATHTFNAMRALDHREPGVLGITLDEDRLYAELICDGIHVAPPLVRLWLRSKQHDGSLTRPATRDLHRAILVTDAMSAAGMPDGAYTLGEFAVTVRDGRALLSEDLAAGKETLAGSLLTLDRAVANLQRFTGCTLGTATRAASHTPAEMLGQTALTRLAPARPAHLNRFDAENRLVQTYLHGRPLDRG